METENVCYTRETAIEKAIEMEGSNYKDYRNAYFRTKEKRTKDLLKELALDELKHKYLLEKALFEDTISLHDLGAGENQSMNLSMFLQNKPLNENSSDQDVMIYAIHEEKRAVDFFNSIAEQSCDENTQKLFKQLGKEEMSHLAQLESLYELIYMPEM